MIDFSINKATLIDRFTFQNKFYLVIWMEISGQQKPVLNLKYFFLCLYVMVARRAQVGPDRHTDWKLEKSGTVRNHPVSTF